MLSCGSVLLVESTLDADLNEFPLFAHDLSLFFTFVIFRSLCKYIVYRSFFIVPLSFNRSKLLAQDQSTTSGIVFVLSTLFCRLISELQVLYFCCTVVTGNFCMSMFTICRLWLVGNFSKM
jgi:hypothetical protein